MQKCRKLFSSRHSAFLVKQPDIYRVTEDGGEILDERTTLCQAAALAQQFLLHFFKKMEKENLVQSLSQTFGLTAPFTQGSQEILRYAQNDKREV